MVDLTDVLVTAAASGAVTILLMFIFYRFWILPYLTEITISIPSSVRELVFPYVDDMKKSMMDEVRANVEEVSKSVKATSARFQRTVNQAAAALDLDEFDLETEDGQQAAKEKLTKSYGADIAVQAITQLIQTIQAGHNKPAKNEKGVTTW